MNRWIRIDQRDRRPLPSTFDDVRYAPELVRHFIEEFTRPGDVVLDPFGGFGTTALVAQQLGRHAVCVELLRDRADYIRAQVPGATVIEGDARRLRDLGVGEVAFVMTSPPYMTSNGHPQDPMSGYESLDGDYRRYLDDIRDVFHQVAELLPVGGRAVVNVANIRRDGITTRLAWDVGAAVSEVMTFDREVIVHDETLAADFTQDYCLIFRR